MSAPPTFCMLLQMAFEKIGKAAAIRNESVSIDEVQKSHEAVQVLVRQFRTSRTSVDLLDEKTADVMGVILKVLEDLERVHPSVQEGGPHLEYPWEELRGGHAKVCKPSTDLPVVQYLSKPESNLGQVMLTFGQAVFDNFDSIFY